MKEGMLYSVLEKTAILKLVNKLNLGMVCYKAMLKEEGTSVTMEHPKDRK